MGEECFREGRFLSFACGCSFFLLFSRLFLPALFPVSPSLLYNLHVFLSFLPFVFLLSPSCFLYFSLVFPCFPPFLSAWRLSTLNGKTPAVFSAGFLHFLNMQVP
jgi:hypothetical protein